MTGGLNNDLSGFDLSVGIPAVRKARQVIGRVLRAPDEVGTRLFLDERYASTGSFDVGQCLSDQEYSEFKTVIPDMLDVAFHQFWDSHELTLTPDAEQQTDPPDSEPQFEDSSTAESSENRTTSTDSNNHTTTSKIYLGEGANVGGWIALPRQLIRDEIVPLVKNNRVSEDDDSINVNFTSEISISGWNHVAPNTVLQDIEPVVKTHREETSKGTDGDSTPNTGQNVVKTSEKQTTTEDTTGTKPEPDTARQHVKCPVTGCGYTGTISQVIPHYSYKTDPNHQDLNTVECPASDCDYSGPLDSVGDHINGKQDGKHNPAILLRLPDFKPVDE